MREIYKNIEFEDEAHVFKSQYNWLFSVFIKFDSLDEKQDGYEEFLETKEALIIALEYEDSAKYVGNIMVDGWSELYFYTSATKGFNSTVSTMLSPTKYIYESNIVKDAKWNFYETQLLPSELDLHHIQSQKIITLLIEEGDDASIQREVEHYAVFDTQTQKERFTNLAILDGFTYKDDIATDKYQYGVALVMHHNMLEDEVKEIVQKLYKLIKKEHGYYEGWSTTLVA